MTEEGTMDAPRATRVLELALFGLFAVVLAIFVTLAALERIFNVSLPELQAFTDASLILFCFLAATTTAWRGKHLSMVDPSASRGPLALALSSASIFVVSFTLCAMSCTMTLVNLWLGRSGTRLDWKPLLFLVVASLVLSLVGMVWRAARSTAAASARGGRVILVSAAVLGFVAGAIASAPSLLLLLENVSEELPPDWIYGFAEGVSSAFRSLGPVPVAIAVLSAFAGTPLFVVLAGIAVMSILGSDSASGIGMDGSIVTAFRLFNDSGSVWSFPIFAVIGFTLASSGAGERLVGLFRRLFRSFSGGELVVAVLASTFFATFTGASGITILALGPMLAIMLRDRYGESMAHGLVASSGTLGLLFPPSIAIAIYVYSVKINLGFDYPLDFLDLYAGALLPGLLMVGATLATALFLGRKKKSGTSLRPDGPSADAPPEKAVGTGKLLLSALPEALIPVIVALLVVLNAFGLHVIGALVVAYILVVETAARKTMTLRGFVSSFADHVPIIGGTIVILFSARFLSEFINRADIPAAFTEWITAAIPAGEGASTFLFLLLLNGALLVVGCFMDIISAIFVVVPLVAPLGAAYGLHPVHLGVLFILNLCIGFLTPPVGMNLFLGSYAFHKPLGRIVRDVLPFFAVQLLVLAIVTWVPWFSTVFAPAATAVLP